ncbi:hypothetical protein PFFCH_05464 [Plasmodium falciparum FCH/4]|uniref:Uncharacterized protein n=1 Tax=Plasmodium falciparum FCH/4 TaxID=1036724 RepID=A0A024VFV0_PLAFA|nr:hypothetical protein PFFCH_05464 [Plasmodium falciparum FCH/4]
MTTGRNTEGMITEEILEEMNLEEEVVNLDEIIEEMNLEEVVANLEDLVREIVP